MDVNTFNMRFCVLQLHTRKCKKKNEAYRWKQANNNRENDRMEKKSDYVNRYE